VNAARSAYLSGFAATSNVEAAVRHQIPIAGTMSHMWILIHDDEEKAFQDFKDVYKAPVLLIDTYDTVKGAEIASKIRLLDGVRLDSGDIHALSKEVRAVLDANGCKSTRIIASSDLNEYKIDELERLNAPIDTYAVGTELVVSRDVPSLGAVYKVVYDDTNDKPLVKLSPGKITMPGRKQIFLDQRNGGWSHLIALENAVAPSEELIPLLDCHIKDGKLMEGSAVNLEVARKYCNAALVNLHPQLASLEPEEKTVPVHPHDSLKTMFEEAVNGLKLANK
jgi:nicotinate phosphoribosyltransferase